MTPTQASFLPDENEFYNDIRNKREKRKPDFKVGDLVRTSSLTELFIKEIPQIEVMIFEQ